MRREYVVDDLRHPLTPTPPPPLKWNKLLPFCVTKVTHECSSDKLELIWALAEISGVMTPNAKKHFSIFAFRTTQLLLAGMILEHE